jgi:hypothetical protein
VSLLLPLLAIAATSAGACRNPEESPVIDARPQAEADRAFRPLPDLTKWAACSGRVTTATAGLLVLEGDDSAFRYQLASPPIPVRPHATVLVRLRIRVDSGRVGLSIADASGARFVGGPAWRIESDEPQEYAFDNGPGSTITVFLVNANPTAIGNAPTRLAVFPGTALD